MKTAVNRCRKLLAPLQGANSSVGDPVVPLDDSLHHRLSSRDPPGRGKTGYGRDARASLTGCAGSLADEKPTDASGSKAGVKVIGRSDGQLRGVMAVSKWLRSFGEAQGVEV